MTAVTQSECAVATARQEPAATEPSGFGRIPGVRRWVRPFSVQWIERPGPERSSNPVTWSFVLLGQQHDPRFEWMRADRSTLPSGLVIWLGEGVDESVTADLFATCHTIWKDVRISHLAICHAGAPVGGFARSLSIERRFASVTVLERAPEHDDMAQLRDALERVNAGFSEARFDRQGRRFEPVFSLHRPVNRQSAALDRRDVILVTGGTKGIGAECALRLASRTGAALLLVGRSPAQHVAVAATLRRAEVLGIRCKYLVADTTDATRLTAAVAASDEFGPVTALLHAAGISEPTLFQNVSDDALRRMMAPKTSGLRVAISAAGPALRRIIAFGSILGRMGLKGQAHYAIANAWQTVIAEDYGLMHNNCDVLALEWSIWSGTGMGHRHGSLDHLARFGVDPIALDDGLAAFERLAIGAVGTMMVTSRFGPPTEISLMPDELPMLRFVDYHLVHYPGLELVVESDLSLERYPYLADRRLDGQAVLPSHVALEAMTQAASVLAGGLDAAAIEDVVFKRVIIVPDGGTTRLRIMALVDDSERVEVVLRASDDDFATDCMQATFIAREFSKPVSAASTAAVKFPDITEAARDPRLTGSNISRRRSTDLRTLDDDGVQ